MNLIKKLSEEKYRVWIRWVSLASQIVVLILALVLVTNIATRQYNSAQMDTIRVEMQEQMYKDRKELDEKLKLLKDELSSYQSTRESRAKFFVEKLNSLEDQVKLNNERVNKRINNLNSKVYYWSGKVKKNEILNKLESEE